MEIALVGGSLIDGSGRDPQPQTTVVIKDTRIAWTGPDKQAPLTKDTRIIDAAGRTVMPGLIDLHVHLSYGRSDPSFWARGLLPPLMEHPLPLIGIKGFARARRTLEMGFTTLRDVGDIGNLAISVRDAINSGTVEGPRIVASGPYLCATSGHGNSMPPWLKRTDMATNVADGVDAVLRFVREQVYLKTDWIKVVATGGGTVNVWDEEQFTDAEMNAIVSEAHRKARRVCAHCIQSKGTLQAVRAGVDTVEHGAILTEEIVELMAQKRTFLVPTLSAIFGLAEHGLERGLSPERVENARANAQRLQKSARMALEAGVPIACGTDCGFTPPDHGDNAYELELLVSKLGMTPMQAIVTATSQSAAALQWQDRLGTVEPDKLADLIVVNEDPLNDIRALQQKANIALVMKDGAVCVDRMM